MKTCCKCRSSKPKDQFYKNRASYDGLSGACKICCKIQQKLWAKTNPIAKRLINLKWKTQNRDRKRIMDRAAQAVFLAIKAGLLVRPNTCQFCQSNSKIEASHNDYSKPLDVVWLCQYCHRLLDAKDPKSGKFSWVPVYNKPVA